MAELIGVDLYELICDKPWPLRYPFLIAKTTRILAMRKAKFVFVQNPSLVLALYASLIKWVLRFTLVVDFHNGGMYPLEGKSKLLNRIARLVARLSDVAIVSNDSLAETMTVWNARPIVFPDPIPTIYFGKERKAMEDSYVLFICTWAKDEPFMEVIEAARILGDEYQIYITGKYEKSLNSEDLKDVPNNVKLLGFVSDDDYVNYLLSASVAIDLTLRESCLVCGAYEAISASVPMIVSEDKEARKIFSKGFLFTKNKALDIANSIKRSFEDRINLVEDIKLLKAERLSESEVCKKRLISALGIE
ncbi:glycosyltransferase [Marinimicrobium sp. LS-A18]|uniref:glycosyltransferase n=1 Tax=Marinimicrobium sp. LS-A18 TaxID=1381596 RepID=UPI00187C5CD2|nr:glycosyltransferase [Marinimicrobium sp. LS-A18]